MTHSFRLGWSFQVGFTQPSESHPGNRTRESAAEGDACLVLIDETGLFLHLVVCGVRSRVGQAPLREADGGREYCVSDNGAGIISNNSGAIVSNNGSAVVGNNGTQMVGKVKLRLAATASAREFALADAAIAVYDAAGKPLLGDDGQPVGAVSDAEGNYTLESRLPRQNLVLRIKLWNGGELSAILPSGGGSRIGVRRSSKASIRRRSCSGRLTSPTRLAT